MFINELFSEAEVQNQIVVLYPGRFQPFHLGHRDVFASLQGKFGRDAVYIATSNKTELPKSPFNFSDKTVFMTAAGVPADRILEVASPYKLPEQFNPEHTIFVVAVGAPDADRLKPDSLKKDGTASYFKTFKSIADCETADQHGYVIIAAERHKVITLNDQQVDVSHGTQSRAAWNSVRNDANGRREFLTQMYGRNDPEVGRVLDKIPVNEDSNMPVANDSSSAIPGISVVETIRKVSGGYRLVSKKGKNLGTYPTHAGAEKRERQVQYFKHAGESVEEGWKEKVGAAALAGAVATGAGANTPKVPLDQAIRDATAVYNINKAVKKQKEKSKEETPKKTDKQVKEFAPDGFNGGDDGEEFNPNLAKMAYDDGVVKGAGLADGATLERAMAINDWDKHDGGIYSQHFAKGFKKGRLDKINFNNKQYNLNLKLMKDGSIRHGEQGVSEDAAGVGVVSNSKDPRYVMATMGDQNDVTAQTLPNMMKAYGLTRKMSKEEKLKVAESLLSQIRALREELAQTRANIKKQ